MVIWILHLGLGVCLAAQPTAEGALPAAETPLTEAPGEPLAAVEALLEEAAQLAERGQFKACLEQTRGALELAESSLPPDAPILEEILALLGERLRAGRSYVEATPHLQRVVERVEARLGPSHLELVAPLDRLANIYKKRRLYEPAWEHYQRALRILETELGMWDPRVAAQLEPMGSQRWLQMQWDEAEALYRRSLEIRTRSQGADHIDLAETLGGLGKVLAGRERLDEAYRVLDRAQEIMSQHYGDPSDELAAGLEKIALSLRSSRDLAGAERYLREAIRVQETQHGAESVEVADLHFTLLTLAHGRMNTEEELALYEEIIRVYRRAGEEHESTLAISLNNLAQVHLKSGRLEEAERAAVESIEIKQRVLGPNSPSMASSLETLAAVQCGQGQWEACFETNLQVLGIYQATVGEEHYRTAFLQVENGRVLLKMGEYQRGLLLLQEATQTLRDSLGPHHPYVTFALDDLSEAYLLLGDHDRARESMEESLGIVARHMEPKDRVSPLLRLLRIALSRGDLQEALRSHELLSGLTLESTKDRYGLLHMSVQLELLRGDPQAAQERLAVLLSDFKDFQVNYYASSNFLTGQVHAALGEHEAALERFEEEQRSLDAKPFFNLRHLKTELHQEIYSSWKRLGDEDAMRESAEALLQHLEHDAELYHSMTEQSALLYLQATQQMLGQWLEAHHREEDHAQAWEHAQRWKGMITRRVQEQRFAENLRSPAYQELSRSLQIVKAKRAALLYQQHSEASLPVASLRWEGLLEEQEQLERQLSALAIDEELRVSAPSVSRERLCEALPESSGLVDFVHYKTDEGGRYLAFVLRPDCSLRRIELGPSGPIDRSVAAWREVMEDPSTSSQWLHRRGLGVSQAVWSPLESSLEGLERVYLIPDSSLAELSFSALPLLDGRYLIESRLLQRLSHPHDLLREPEPPSSGLLALGGLDFGPVADSGGDAAFRSSSCVLHDYDYLPGTEEEVRLLEQEWRSSPYRRSPLTLLRGAQGSEEELRRELEGHRILHLATHGFRKSEHCASALQASAEGRGMDPMLLSGLVLAGANAGSVHQTYDNVLTAEEVSLLDLRGTELVVLSACESGLGEATQGEGVLGLQRAFVLAGAESMIMSLWSISDQQTRELMEDFYQSLLRRRRHWDPGEALRDAQLSMLARQRAGEAGISPRSWGAFTFSSTAVQ